MKARKIAIIGSGSMGTAMKTALAGEEVKMGLRNPKNKDEIPVKDAVDWADVVVLVVPASAVGDVFIQTKGALKSKVVIDCTNPLKWDNGPVWDPPKEGSCTAHLDALGCKKVVKAFSTFGFDHVKVGSGAQLFLAGDDAEAKEAAGMMAKRMKFKLEPVDLGPLRNCAVLENMAMAWIHLATVGGMGRDFALNLVKD
jgi:predicted dinucleotide-binding enzyme